MAPPSSFRLDSNPAMQSHNLRRQLKQDPHLSATCIRSLVKQLAPSRSKDSMHPDLSPPPNSTTQGEVSDASPTQKSTHRRPHKRQVRRRLHPTRPYQDRLLNMAEARKEIATALKFHRASMKQATQRPQQEAKQQQQHPTVPILPPQHPCFAQDGGIMSQRNPRIYPSCTNNFSNLVDDFSFSSFSHPALSLPNPPNWPPASPAAPPRMAGNLSYNLPNRPLGLNLNFQDFVNLDAPLYVDNNNASFYSHSSSSSSSPSLSVSADQEVPSVAISQGEGTSALADAIDSIAATQHCGPSS
ncbi:uncharacterized protein LOC114749706 [Neltuma alba]|uniref:uncharacterized protein LOC114749706 n=1 Tax=Neltuma alba TaxID=207710 RepID=UPI0010A54C5C|nr:uncharacterized protein LOC114749706 [Prosopis alba]